MNAIAKNEAPFRFIPTEIGELKFCYTNNIKSEPYSKQEKNKKLFTWIGSCVAISTVCWLIFNNSPIFDTILSITALIVIFKTINNDTLKNLWFENVNLVIEHINHSKKYFGLVEKGNIEHIPLTNIGNKKLFMLYLQTVIKF